jgi:hypothetical protein
MTNYINCISCNEYLEHTLKNFTKHRTLLNGVVRLKNKCKKCQKEYIKQYYKDNPDKKKCVYKNRPANTAKLLYIKNYCKDNNEKRTEYYRKRRDDKRDEFNEYYRKYRIYKKYDLCIKYLFR